MPGKMARSDPRPSVRVTRGVGSGQHFASVLQEGRENANIDAGLGFIWRISVQLSSDVRNRSSLDVLYSQTGFVADLRAAIMSEIDPLLGKLFWQDDGQTYIFGQITQALGNGFYLASLDERPGGRRPEQSQ